MKKISLFALFSLSILGGLAAATPAFAADGTEAGSQQVVNGANGTNTADIEVNGTLGANNTDPGATIPEGFLDQCKCPNYNYFLQYSG